jgi:isocitrate dehydrogenase
MSRKATSSACVKSRMLRFATGSSWPSHALAQSGMPVVFWLDPYRPHENELIKKVHALPQGPRHHRPRHPDHVAGSRHALHTGTGNSRASTPYRRRAIFCATTSPTCFPIMELGTSAKMLSIVPLMAGGGMYETGCWRIRTEACTAIGRRESPALGFAWASFLAIAVFTRGPGHQDRQHRAATSGEGRLTLLPAKLLDNRKSPSPKTGELDNQGQPVLPCDVLGKRTRHANGR